MFQDGKLEGSVLTVATVESLTVYDKQMWRAIRKELEEIGISVAAFDANKEFITNWFESAIKTGAFEEQSLPGDSNSVRSGNDSPKILSHHSSSSQLVENVQQDLDDFSIASVTPQVSPSIVVQKATAADKAEVTSTESPHSEQQQRPSKAVIPLRIPKDATSSTERTVVDPVEYSVQRQRPPRVVSLIAWMLRYSKAFLGACTRLDYATAGEML